MKIYKLLQLACLIVASIGCSNKENTPVPDNESPIVAQKLIGVWTMTAQTSSVAWDWDGNGSTETDMYANYSACLKQTSLKSILMFVCLTRLCFCFYSTQIIHVYRKSYSRRIRYARR